MLNGFEVEERDEFGDSESRWMKRAIAALMIITAALSAWPAEAAREQSIRAYLERKGPHLLVVEQRPAPVQIASLSLTARDKLYFVNWLVGCLTSGGCTLEVYRQSAGRIRNIGNIPIVKGRVAILHSRTHGLPDFMVDRWGLYSKIVYDGRRYHPVWNKSPAVFPSGRMPGRIILSRRTPTTLID